jgi:ATP-dependent helicase HepA
MAVAQIGEFVRSRENRLGVGKINKLTRTAVTIDYFLGPGIPPRTETVPIASVARVVLDCETRVYEVLPGGTSWRAGRALAESVGKYLVQFPNARKLETIPATELYTRCDLPIPDPAAFLAARITETPIWQQRRAGFVRAAIAQRGACAGMTGLLSSCIDLEPHQIEVIRRVLQDPVQRYLLADEVGLGKTIEAGVILRQYVLEHPSDHSVLVLVPGHLEKQWRGELTQRFRLGPLLDQSIHILAHDADLKAHKGAGLVVIDEAHQLARWAGAPRATKPRQRFANIAKLVTDTDTRLLLLSATPTLHSDESGFQALLHLLDPVMYPLGDLKGFRNRLERHQTVAQLYHLFKPDEEGSYLEGALKQFTDAFPNDERLASFAKGLKPFLKYGADPDAPERAERIRAVRAHVSEAYRLHRRLLRNRRADDRVEGLLPGRAGVERWAYTDPATAPLLAALDHWRAAAAKGAKAVLAANFGRVFVLFAEAAACDATALSELVLARLGEGDAPANLPTDDLEALKETPMFTGEVAALQKLRDAAEEAESLVRIDALVAGLKNLFDATKAKVPARAVVFASYPHVADEVFDALNLRWPGQVVRHGRAGWQHFRTSTSFRVLVGDRTAEEGLNLHGRGTVLVHFDLPWSPNRVEQRVGRLDRYGVATPVRSVVLAADGDALAAAWVEYLNRGYKAFDRSVAALQYLTETELAALYPAALAEGAAALAAATEKLAGENGVVETALREIQVLDELDAVEAPAGHENFADELARADHETRADWQAVAHTWVVEGLQFARRQEGPPEADVGRYQFQRPRPTGPSTLMPVGRMVRHFGHIIDTDDERSTPERPMTYALAFDRRKAQNYNAALARIGDPFIDALVDYVNWDDRGAVAALWRYRPKTKLAKPAEVAFRFEFVVDCPIADALAALPKEGAWSAHAVRRQADWQFPPVPLSVWLDQNLDPVTNAARLALLTEDYSKMKRADGGKDFNLNAERWAALDPHFARAAWAKLVTAARKAAEEYVRGTDEWAARVTERLNAADRDAADRDAQTASRLAFLSGKHRDTEAARAKVERAVAAALRAGIETPAVRLDSIAAVFLANWNPFADLDE